MALPFTPRPNQKQIAAYRGGTMGISAVPGSGKTWTLSYLAAELIKNNLLDPDQEILIVTLVNSAVHNFSQRISGFLASAGLIPTLGYRVRTLHGLAHDIVQERPELAGLDSSFQIIDEREAIRIREDAVRSWLAERSGEIDSYLISDLSDYKKSDLLSSQIPALLNQIALQFIRSAKNLQLSPRDISNHLENSAPNLLLDFGSQIYQTYQKNLSFRGAVDFDDLITKAYQALMLDHSLLSRLQDKWPFILEDEAQDSSLLQQKTLSLLASQGDQQNWVRVGDPNQAIYESFTTADPQLLIDFIQKAQFVYTLPHSGRNSREIISLANHLVHWCNQDHPNPDVRNALFPSEITPTPPGDAQPNPPNMPDAIHLYDRALEPEEEIQIIASSISNWLDSHPDSTGAVLVPRNERGKTLASVLRNDFQVEPVELLNSTLATRKTTGALVRIIAYLISPGSSKKLARAYQVFRRGSRQNPDQWEKTKAVADLLSSLAYPEEYLDPLNRTGWSEPLEQADEFTQSELIEFRSRVHKWHQAASLPIDQLILTIAADIFSEPAEINLAHQIANFERQLSNANPDWGLPVLLDELRALARNERRFMGSRDESEFNPEEHKGKIVITTAHKAKGLEWDRVYLISANDYNFPAGLPEDRYISEKWFIRDHLNLPAETLAQLNRLSDPDTTPIPEGEASKLARLEYVRERLRLFYVSITRAKSELIVTWNTGRNGQSGPALAFQALASYQDPGDSIGHVND